jgi:transcriptional regulator with XRE-family HTH domain
MSPTRLEELARAKGFTQEEIARRSNLTLSTVRRLWQDRDYKEDPRMSTVRGIATVLGVSVSDLGYSVERPSLPDMQMGRVAVAA